MDDFQGGTTKSPPLGKRAAGKSPLEISLRKPFLADMPSLKKRLRLGYLLWLGLFGVLFHGVRFFMRGALFLGEGVFFQGIFLNYIFIWAPWIFLSYFFKVNKNYLPAF